MVKICETPENLWRVLEIVKRRNLYDVDISIAQLVIHLDNEINYLEALNEEWRKHTQKLLGEIAAQRRTIRELTRELNNCRRQDSE